ncbi:unnamed protein product (macronuclear) [Paramecium tetraurelia]|uniref:Uncharacterized protein n=1 Tax=Paramecium tetraurelia TaxID=5888 RepID=A0CEP0_PARTE|nr:uncharacterized protein GSPATT00037696001 [Paramecium tetraurelia]CAK69257.1 unnamed protein product [Paramecium tetraurelia]|eukprot:XP_001436654.1 hypothetical protein (macronuclear) [Paramecium tetraurelia strain d4-2]
MHPYLKPARSLHLASQKDELKSKSNQRDIDFDPASFLNNFDALPDYNLRFKSESISLLTKQTEQKREMQKTQHTKFLVLPKINSKFVRDNAVEDVYFFPETKQKYQHQSRILHSNTVLQPSSIDKSSKSFKDLEQLQAKKKKVEFNTALEIVDIEGRVSTEIIHPEQQTMPRQKRFSRLKTLEC